MRPVYAVQFEVRSPDPASHASAISAVTDSTAAWVTGWYRHWKNLDVTIPVESGVIAPAELHRLEVTAATSGDNALWSLSWSDPSEPDENLLWQSAVTAARAEDKTEVSIVIRITSREFVIAPPTFDVRRPYIVKSLLHTLPCYLGGRPLRTAPQAIGVEDGQSFETLLFDPRRPLPIVLFSRDPYSEQCITSPVRTAEALAGLAEVYVLADKWAGFRLTRSVGKALSCYNGAVRIYWPGLSPDSSPYAHKLFMPDEVRERQDAGQDFADHLMRRFAGISALRLTQPATEQRVRALLTADRAREAAKLRQQIQSGTAAKTELEEQFLELQDELEREVEARRAVEKQRDDAQFRVAELEEENNQHRENLRAMSLFRPAEAEAASPAAPTPPADPKSVRDALDRAAADFTDRLTALPSAVESADESDFARPTEVYEALMAIRDLADAYFKKAGGAATGPWERWFETGASSMQQPSRRTR